MERSNRLSLKNSLLLLIPCLLLINCNSIPEKGARISGHVLNSNQEYINLNYFPRLRGNLNFDGFTSVGSNLDSKGNFELNSNNITDEANYALELKNKNIPLIIFHGDDIHLTFDINNPNHSLIATGKGAGKINVLNLKQFSFDNFDLKTYESLDKFTSHIDHITLKQINLLESIYFKKSNHEIISQADNKIEIQKIIKNTPLSEKEYHFLLNLIQFQKYSLLSSFLSKTTGLGNFGSEEINLSDKAFECFNKQEYRKLDNINDWHLANSLESILQIEYLKKLSELENIRITYGNWQSYFSSSEYINWSSSFLRNNFNHDIYNKYSADLSAWLMTLGYDFKAFSEKLDNDNRNNKYLKRLSEFENLLNTGLSNEHYDLNDSNLTLNKSKFDALLENYKGQALFIVFWSAQYAGTSIVNNIHSIKDFEEANREKVSIVNICIDKKENKRIWAARIIDNMWNSKHYFLPIEGNDSILNRFSDRKISAFCDGGATYAFINKRGIIDSAIEFPFHLTANEIEKMIK